MTDKPKFELIDKDGNRVANGRWLCTDCDTHFALLDTTNRCGCGSGRVIGKGFSSAIEAADWARRWWPDQSQDPGRTGAGWDVQVVGADQPPAAWAEAKLEIDEGWPDR